MKPLDPTTNPPSSVTVLLNDEGWTWNQDYTWADPRTGEAHHVRAAVRLACCRGAVRVQGEDKKY